MNRWRLALIALLLAPLPALAQGGPPAARPGGARVPAEVAAARRQQLRQQVFARFMDRASRRLALTAEDRLRVEQVLLRGEAQRAALAQEARAVRRALAAAGRDSATPQQEYDRLLKRMTELRTQELALWEREQAELGQVLTPRQRAQLMAMRLELFERVQRMREQRLRTAERLGPPR